jgi:hypothetical protein
VQIRGKRKLDGQKRACIEATSQTDGEKSTLRRKGESQRVRQKKKESAGRKRKIKKREKQHKWYICFTKTACLYVASISFSTLAFA